MQEHANLGLPQTVPELFARADPARPFITWYDDATGERAELSGATLGNWVAKTANLLVDGCGLGPGDAALVDAPPHWQTAAVLLGCWSAGLRVDPDATAATGAADVVFAAADRAARHATEHTATGAVEVYGLALLPLAAPMREPVPGVVDFVGEVRQFGDEFQPATPVAPEDAATPGTSHAELCRAAAQRAGTLDLAAGTRVLLAAESHPDPLDWLLAPLAAGASVVLCANLDPDQVAPRVRSERVTVTRT